MWARISSRNQRLMVLYHGQQPVAAKFLFVSALFVVDATVAVDVVSPVQKKSGRRFLVIMCIEQDGERL